MHPGPPYRRILLHFAHDPVYAPVIDATAELAQLLGLDFRALFVEDEAVFGLAALPFGREFRLPTHEWRTIDAERLASEYRHAAETARQRAQRAARAVGVAFSFDVLRGDPIACIATTSQADDIVVIAGPRRGTPPTGGILYVPPGVDLRNGPIVAVLASADDPALDVAAAIARAGDEPLVAVVGTPSREVDRAVIERVRTVLSEDRVTVRHAADLSAADLAVPLAGVRERLVVLGGDAAAELEPIAQARRVPVLLVSARAR